jgi:hypothetical protein
MPVSHSVDQVHRMGDIIPGAPGHAATSQHLRDGRVPQMAARAGIRSPRQTLLRTEKQTRLPETLGFLKL